MLIYILYVNYHSKEISIDDIKTYLRHVAEIVTNRKSVIDGPDASAMKFTDDYTTVDAIHNVCEITLLDYIDYYYYDVYVYNYIIKYNK